MHSHTYSKCSMKGGNLSKLTRWSEPPGNSPIGTFLPVYDLLHTHTHTHRAYSTKLSPKYLNNHIIPHSGCNLESGLNKGKHKAAMMHVTPRLLHSLDTIHTKGTPKPTHSSHWCLFYKLRRARCCWAFLAHSIAFQFLSQLPKFLWTVWKRAPWTFQKTHLGFYVTIFCQYYSSTFLALILM